MRWQHKKTTLRLEDLQQQQLKEIGLHLQERRQGQGLSLETMASKTLIQRRILKAIETASLTDLPEPVYVRGFIQRYAEALGLEGRGIAEAFPLEAAIASAAMSWQPAAQLRPMHLYAMYVALIAASVNGLSAVMNRSDALVATPINSEAIAQANGLNLTPGASSTGQAQRSPGTSRSPVMAALQATFPLAAPPSTPLGAQTLASFLPAAAEKTSDKAVQVKLTLQDESWLMVLVDGKTAFEGVMMQGAQRTWEGSKQVVVRAGNAGGVLVALNNQPAKPMGMPGAVEEIAYGPTPAATSVSLPQMAGSGLGALTERLGR